MKYIKKLKLIRESSELENSILSLIEDYPECTFDSNVLRIKVPHIPCMSSIEDINLYDKSVEEYNLILKELIICLNRTGHSFITNYSQYINILEVRFRSTEPIIMEQPDRILLNINDLETKLLSTNPTLDDLAITTDNNLLFISVNSDSCSEDDFNDLIRLELKELLKETNIETKQSSIEDVDDHSNFYVSITITFNKKIIEV